MTDRLLRAMLRQFRTELEGLYADRLKGVYLIGSYARGTATDESDVDLLIVLDRIDHYGAEIDRTSHLVSNLGLAFEVSPSRVFVSEADWTSKDSRFLTNARHDAQAA